MKPLEHDIDHVLFSEEQLAQRVAEIAAQIDKDYAGKEPLLVSVLRGSFVFMADLVRQITVPCTVDFMAVSSYGSGTTSSGQVKIVKDLSETIEGKDVIVVEISWTAAIPFPTSSSCWRPAVRRPSVSAPCWISRSAAPSRWKSSTPASPFPMNLWWATAWTTTSATATCLTLACSSPRCTAANDGA